MEFTREERRVLANENDSKKAACMILIMRLKNRIANPQPGDNMESMKHNLAGFEKDLAEMEKKVMTLDELTSRGYASRKELAPYIKYERNEGRDNDFGLLMITIYDLNDVKWGYSEEDNIYTPEGR